MAQSSSIHPHYAAVRATAQILSNPAYIVSNPSVNHFNKPGVVFEVADPKADEHDGLNYAAADFIVRGTHRPATEEEIEQFHADRKRRERDVIAAERDRKQKVYLERADSESLSPELEERMMAKLLARMNAEKETKKNKVSEN